MFLNILRISASNVLEMFLNIIVACEQVHLRKNWGKEKKRRRGEGGGKGKMIFPFPPPPPPLPSPFYIFSPIPAQMSLFAG